jgi:SAM-dependent methyltransferase
MRKGVILLATMSEFGTVDAVMQEIAESCHAMSRFGWEMSVLFVDDGGDPRFFELCEDLGHRYGIETTVIDGPRAGLGAAILHGFNRCLDDESIEFIVNLDADGQHDARQLGDLLRAHTTAGADITIGSRWARGGRCYGLTFSRKVLSRVSAGFLHIAGVPRAVKDPTTSFRVYGRLAAERLRRDLVGFNGFSFFGAAISLADAHDLKVIETPIHFRPRLTGDSNLHFRQILRAVRDLPSVRSSKHQVKFRRVGFLEADHGSDGPDAYNASRELELLSNTPRSTSIILDELTPHLGKRVLEVGAGLGHINVQLRRRGHVTFAVEPDPQLFLKARGSGDLPEESAFQGTLESLFACRPDLVGSFDTILYINVLEHIEDDQAELKIARSFLKPNGNVVIFVPALPALYGTMDEVSGHFRRYRPSELRSVLRHGHLVPRRLWFFDSVGILPYWLSYAVLRRKSLGAGSVRLYDQVIIPLSRLISRITRQRVIGKNLIAIGEKAA